MNTTKKVLAGAVGLTTALFLAAPTAMASYGYNHYYGNNQSSDITVSNDSSAHVSNSVTITSSTGGNTANGGNGDNGGNATATKGSAVAGNGGNGGNGGEIFTGDAWASSYITNKVNSNDTFVKTSCGCTGDIDVSNDNYATVGNWVTLEAKTGYNTANGGDGANGGNATANGGQSYGYHHYYGSNGGNAWGGNGGNGGNGGLIVTGASDAHSSITNSVNRNTTKIVRTGASY